MKVIVTGLLGSFGWERLLAGPSRHEFDLLPSSGY